MRVDVDKRPGSHTSRKWKNVGPEDKDNNSKARAGGGEQEHEGLQGSLLQPIHRSEVTGLLPNPRILACRLPGIPSLWPFKILPAFKQPKGTTMKRSFTAEHMISPSS